MTTCPAFTSITAETFFLTKDNIDDPIPSVFDRTPGTVVNVTCRTGYQLLGQSTFTCQSTGQWSYTAAPVCTRDAATRSPVDPVDDDTNILIGVVCGVSALIVIVLICLMVCVWYRNVRYKQRNDPAYEMNSRMTDRGFRDDRNAYGGRSMAPPPYRSEFSYPPYRHSRPNYDESSLRSGPMYLPRSQPEYSDYYNKLKESRKKPKLIDKEYERKGNRPYVRDWVRRSSSREYDTPSIHGRSGYRDSQLWRGSLY